MATNPNRYPAYDPAKIKARRVALGLRQDEVADLGACSQPHLSLIETGQRRPSTDILTALAKVLDCSIEDFAPDRGEAA